jgi:hypothetical protein
LPTLEAVLCQAEPAIRMAPTICGCTGSRWARNFLVLFPPTLRYFGKSMDIQLQSRRHLIVLISLAALAWFQEPAQATPANRTALEKHYEKFLAQNLRNCSTCHLPSANKSPEKLEDFPHNPFGHRLRLLGEELVKSGGRKDIPTRLAMVAQEDSDGDGVKNETEILLGHAPGDGQDKPAAEELKQVSQRSAEFAAFLASYRWQPFETVKRPPVPKIKNSEWARNPIDHFVAAEHDARKLKSRPEAPKQILLRRVYLDLIGLSPTPPELEAFENDRSAMAYEKVVDQLLSDPRYGERWGRHWMDVWRYSDWAGWTDGGQVRDSQPHIWRWRDWIIESLNSDKGYDRMVIEMLAADELAPEDTDALRATGYLVRNFKLLSREQWMEDTINHTSKAFLGLTMHCAKCHNHMYDPITQRDYYEMRAIFEPHKVRIDRIPGQADTKKDGLVRVYDSETNAPTWLFVRGDERHPNTNEVIPPSIPKFLKGALQIEPRSLPYFAYQPDKRSFVMKDSVVASELGVVEARKAVDKIKADGKATPEKVAESESNALVVEARHAALLAVVRAEKLEEAGRKESEEWKSAASEAVAAQRKLALLESKHSLILAEQARQTAQVKADEAAKAVEASEKENQDKPDTDKVAAKKAASEKRAKELETAKTKFSEAQKALVKAEEDLKAAPATAYKPRPINTYPSATTGRRLAFARWLTDTNNPLTARVAMNQIWSHHFGRGIVPSMADFGANGRAPSHPQLLDWLAAELMAGNWQMKAVHRLIVTSSTYRMASTPDAANAALDPDNTFLWRMPSRRLEAEIVRDNLLYASGQLDLAMAGPEVDHKLGLSSKRRSVYLRIAAEKEVEFLKIFDGPSVTECYERKPSVMPQQALALANSEIALTQARLLAQALAKESGNQADEFITRAFQRILARGPTAEEMKLCRGFLHGKGSSENNVSLAKPDLIDAALRKNDGAVGIQRARENLVLVLLNHNDFVTIR